MFTFVSAAAHCAHRYFMAYSCEQRPALGGRIALVHLTGKTGATEMRVTCVSMNLRTAPLARLAEVARAHAGGHAA